MCEARATSSPSAHATVRGVPQLQENGLTNAKHSSKSFCMLLPPIALLFPCRHPLADAVLLGEGEHNPEGAIRSSRRPWRKRVPRSFLRLYRRVGGTGKGRDCHAFSFSVSCKLRPFGGGEAARGLFLALGM